jgi:pyruvate dehydrogenase E2 component (dihydrolipoamide acetyltransferase)
LAWLAVAAALLGGCVRFQRHPTALDQSADRFVTLGRERIFVRDQGQGPAVLFIHGYGGTHDAWVEVADALAAEHRVLLVDLPGFGRSDKYPGDYSPDGLGRKLLALLDQQGVPRVHLVAHSWGSALALAMALRAPGRVASLTLVSPWVFEEQVAPFFRWARVRGLGEALYALFYDQRLDDRIAATFHRPGPHLDPAVVDRVRASMRRPGAKAAALAAARGMRFAGLQRRYPRVTRPTLLVSCVRDPVSWPRFVHRLHGILPRAELLMLEQCAHMPQLERPRALVARLRSHLRLHASEAVAK